MGHYYSEMCCDICREIICRCPRKPRKPQFVICWPGEIIEESKVTQLRWSLPHFDNLKEAQDALPKWIEEQMSERENKIFELQKEVKQLSDLYRKVQEELSGNQ